MPAYGNMDIGFAGLKQGIGNSEVVSRTALDEIAFGAPVYLVEGNQEACSGIAGAGKVLAGVAQSTQKVGSTYKQYETVNIQIEGEILVTVADAVVANKPAYLTAGGAWTDEATGNTATPYFFRTAAAANGLATLQLIKKPAI